MANQFSEQAAGRIEDISAKQGAAAGYAALQKEYDSFKSSHNAADTAAFWSQLEDKLQKDKVLPELAVAWADKKHNDLSRDGDLTPYDLNQVSRHSDSTDLDKGMAKNLLSKFDQLKNEHADKVNTNIFGYGGTEKDAITPDDLTTHIRKAEGERLARIESERQLDASKKLSEPLFRSTDGNPNHTLFKTIDALPGGKMDDKITLSDLQRYMEEYKVREQHGDLGKQFNPENKKVVENLIKNWNTPDVQHLTEKSTGAISPESAAKAAGFKDAKEMIAQDTVKTPPENPKPPENNPKPPEHKENPPHPENKPQPPVGSEAWRNLQRQALKSLEGEIRNTGDRVLQPGDTLWAIAAANLKVNGNDHASGRDILNEIKNIKRLNGVDENKDWMPKPGTVVRLSDYD